MDGNAATTIPSVVAANVAASAQLANACSRSRFAEGRTTRRLRASATAVPTFRARADPRKIDSDLDFQVRVHFIVFQADVELGFVLFDQRIL